MTVSNQNLVDNFASGYRFIDPPSCINEQDKTCNHKHPPTPTCARAQHLKFAVKERRKRWKRKRIERKKKIMNRQIGGGRKKWGKMNSGWRRNSEKVAGGKGMRFISITLSFSLSVCLFFVLCRKQTNRSRIKMKKKMYACFLRDHFDHQYC